MTILKKDEFNKKIFLNIDNIVKKYKLIDNGDTIAIALSGGKDSVLTLHALHKLRENPKFLDFNIVAITVDEGIEHYRSHGLDAAINNAKDLDIEIIVKSFKKEIGFALDDIYTYFKSACIPCGVFRRDILNKTAYSIGSDKIATGHNLDDEIQSYLMSFSRADLFKFSKFGPKLDKIHPKLIPRIKPLWNTTEKDVGIWAVMNNVNIHLDECPYSKLSLRSKTKNFLNKTESKHYGIKKNIMKSFKCMFNMESPITKINECNICGQPCSSTVCKACEIIDIIKTNKNNLSY
jgi:uncharacterized protein (TIGR00269 family)